MAATSCRSAAIHVARQLEAIEAVISADVLGRGRGPRPGMTIEVAVADTTTPTAVLDTLANHDADLVEATPQGPAMIVVAAL